MASSVGLLWFQCEGGAYLDEGSTQRTLRGKFRHMQATQIVPALHARSTFVQRQEAVNDRGA